MRLTHGLLRNLRIWMEKHMLPDWSYSNFADFLVAQSFIEREVTRIPSVQRDALRAFVCGAPIMNGLQ